MLKRALIAATAAVVLIVGFAIPALAANTQAWEQRRIATEAFDTAAGSATDAAARSAAALSVLEKARDAAGVTLAQGTAVAGAASGYFAEALVRSLTASTAALDAGLATEITDGLAMPSTERPEKIAELASAAGPLTSWATDEKQRASSITALANQLDDLSATVGSATLALTTTVTAEAASALAAAPLASAEARTAVEKARDAVLAATEFAKPVADYTAAVAALRASQQAAVDAAAAAEAASESESSSNSVRAPLVPVGFPRPSYCDALHPVGDPACD